LIAFQSYEIRSADPEPLGQTLEQQIKQQINHQILIKIS